MCPYNNLSMSSRIDCFCFSKSLSAIAPMSNKECKSFICLIYVDLSSAALTGVIVVGGLSTLRTGDELLFF